MAELSTKTRPVARTPEIPVLPTIRLVEVVDRTARLSTQVLKSLETSDVSAITESSPELITEIPHPWV